MLPTRVTHVGKKYIEMQQSWFMPMYKEQAMNICGFDREDKKKLHEVWKAVEDEAITLMFP